MNRAPAEVRRSVVCCYDATTSCRATVAVIATQAMIVLRQLDNFRLPPRITTTKTIRRRRMPAAGCSESTERNGISRDIESAVVGPDARYPTQKDHRVYAQSVTTCCNVQYDVGGCTLLLSDNQPSINIPHVASFFFFDASLYTRRREMINNCLPNSCYHSMPMCKVVLFSPTETETETIVNEN